jgi:peptidoglycan/xylan/chitin deacetylase (PgdA/CDA1 family)
MKMRSHSRFIALSYHDVLDGSAAAGDVLRASPAKYALQYTAFRDHLCSVLESTSVSSVRTIEDNRKWTEKPVFLTFDDGAIGAYTCVAPELERLGWRGHFFIVSDWIGRPGFMCAEQLRGLRRRGHVIGSHSRSHPPRISHLGKAELIREWSESTNVLRTILGEPVRIASVPNGFYTPYVGKAAADAGIEVLFTSNPTSTPVISNGVLLLGRYAIFGDTPAQIAGALAAASRWPRWRQAAMWKLKQGAKRLGGEAYLRLRRQVLAGVHRV